MPRAPASSHDSDHLELASECFHHGASAQKHFEAAFVIVSERLLSKAELAFIDGRARAIEATTPDEVISFPAATRGLGSMRTKLTAP